MGKVIHQYIQPMFVSEYKREYQNFILENLFFKGNLKIPSYQEFNNKMIENKNEQFALEENFRGRSTINSVNVGVMEYQGNDSQRSIKRTDKTGIDFLTNLPKYTLFRYHSAKEELQNLVDKKKASRDNLKVFLANN